MNIVKNLTAQMVNRHTDLGLKEVQAHLVALKSGKKVLGEKRITQAQAAGSKIFGPAWLRSALARTGEPESTLDLKELLDRATAILDAIKASNEASRARRLRAQFGGEISQWIR